MGWGFVGDAWDATKDFGEKAVDKVYENTAKPFVDASKAGYYGVQGDWDKAGGALKDAYSNNVYGQVATGAYDRGAAILKGDANGAIKAQYDMQNGVDATNAGAVISPITEVAQDMRADQLAPPKPGGGGSGAQAGQLSRTATITDGLKAAYENARSTTPPVNVGMVEGPSAINSKQRELSTRLAPSSSAAWASMSAPRPVTAATATAGTTQNGQTADSRGRLVGALGLTQDAASGNAPSAADRGAAIASDKAVARARGLAASVQGRSVGGALQQSQQAGAAALSEIAAQQMANRANEQAVARGQLLSGVGALREGDTSQAATDATLATNVSQTNAAGTNTVNLGNAANQLAANTTNATLATNTNISNADRAAGMAKAQGEITSREGIAANELASREATTLAQLQLQAQQGNQDAQLRLRAIQDAKLSGDRDAYLRALGLETTLVSGIDATNAQRQASDDAYKGAIVTGLVQGGVAYFGGGK